MSDKKTGTSVNSVNRIEEGIDEDEEVITVGQKRQEIVFKIAFLSILAGFLLFLILMATVAL